MLLNTLPDVWNVYKLRPNINGQQVFLHHFPTPKWKWEVLTMDFITKIPTKSIQRDCIMVVVEKLSKSTHFILIKATHKTNDIARIFMREIPIFHGLPKEIVSDMDTMFTSNFWKSLFKFLGTHLNFNTTYHPQTNGQNERVNQVIANMLCMYVMNKPSKWEDYLYLVDFAYNNRHQTTLEMGLFEAFYGRKCRSLVSWDNPINRILLG